MAMITTARRINPTIQRRSGSAKKGVYATLFLTSMVDMFAIMVIFLLNSFSPEGEIIVLTKGFELPKVVNTGQLSQAPSIVIGLEEITFDGEVIGKTADVAAATDWNIPGLQQILTDRKAALEEELKAAGVPQTADGQFELTEEQMRELRKINVSADKRLPFETVKKVIYTAGFAGFPDFRLAVLKGSEQEIMEDRAAQPRQ